MKGNKALWIVGGLLVAFVLFMAIPFGFYRFMQPNYKYNPRDIDENRSDNSGPQGDNYGPETVRDNEFNNNYGPGMMGNNRFNNGYGSRMMGQWGNGYSPRENKNMEKINIKEVEKVVESYLDNYNEDLEIADIFVYSDTDYYVSIEETNTGKGAMELLVNPYSGVVYPETGPNMMWNDKYSMMGNRFRSNTKKNLSKTEAVEIADNYVKDSLGSDYLVTNEGHEFYGYYTFHVNNESETVGMISVNYDTGDVWYHTWHGQLEEVISHHED